MAAYNFQGKVALVTGGGSGIGRECCQLLARDGARVLVTDRDLNTAQQTVSLLPGGGDHLALAMDVTDKSAVEAAFRQALAKYGAPPTLLVNNAGIASMAGVVDEEEEKLNDILDVNLKGVFRVSQQFSQQLIQEKAGPGAIVNIASIVGKSQFGTIMAAYSASKGGVIALTKSCAMELAPQEIRVNCVLPGAIDTPILAVLDSMPDTKANIVKSIPMGRLGRPQEVAEVVVFLLSERSSYMTGASVEVTGGLLM